MPCTPHMMYMYMCSLVLFDHVYCMSCLLPLSLVPHKKQVLLRWQESEVNRSHHNATETGDKVTVLPERDDIDAQSKELLQLPVSGKCEDLR